MFVTETIPINENKMNRKFMVFINARYNQNNPPGPKNVSVVDQF